MTWNVRIIEFGQLCGEVRFRSMHEVYYDADGKPNSYSETPFKVSWELDGTPLTDKHHKPALLHIAMLQRALLMPVLQEADFNQPKCSPVDAAMAEDAK